MFKIGEKVVCIGEFKGIHNPKINDIVEIIDVSTDYGILYLKLKGFEYEICGRLQGFIYTKFRKLDYEFTENILAEITESVMQNQN